MKRFIFIIISFIACSTSLMSQETIFRSNPFLDNPYGICSHISMASRDFPFYKENIDEMERIGIGNVRTDFCTTADREELNSNFSDIDEVYNYCLKKNISLLPIITGFNAYDSWLADVETMRKRYPEIHCWEIINEPDIQYENYGYPDVGEYAYMLDKACSVLHSSNKNKTKVLTGGFGNTQGDYFKKFIRKADRDSYDVLNFHIYTGRGNLPESAIKTFESLKSRMTEYGIDCPVYLTETGYSTVGYGFGKKDFLNETVPEALESLGLKLKDVTIGVISNAENGYFVPSDLLDSEVYSKVKYIELDSLAALEPNKVRVLIPALDEAFPMQYIDALTSYLKKGGTVILSGGAPLFYGYDAFNGRFAVGGKYYNRLHIGVQFPWTVLPWQKAVPDDSRFLTEDNLKGNDRLIPIEKKDGGIISGIYCLDSELKGNIIINTNIHEKGLPYVAQAERLPRMFLIAFSFGVEKVFWYHLRSFEISESDFESHLGIVHKDFTTKPSWQSYKTLVRMCPNHSTRPMLTVNDGLYVCSWRIPEGEYVTAVWTTGEERKLTLPAGFAGTCIDVYGRNTGGRCIKAGPSIIYLRSKKKILINSAGYDSNKE